MGGGHTELSGPDLEQGIPLSRREEGATIGRDRDSLRAEAAMERHHRAALESLVAPGGQIPHA